MGKRVVLIISAVIALIGIGLFAAGSVLAAGDTTEDNRIDLFDPESFKDGATGTVHLNAEDIYEWEKGLCTVVDYDEEENGVFTFITGVDTNRFAVGLFLVPRDAEGRMIFSVTVKPCPEENRQKVLNAMYDSYYTLYERVADDPDTSPELMSMLEYYISDEGRADMDEGMSHLMLEVTPTTNYGLMKTAGIVIAALGALVAVICLLSYKVKGRTIVLGFVVLLVVAAGVCLFMLRKHITTVASLKEHSTGVYTLKYTADYKLDKILDSNITNEGELLGWAEKELYFGMPVSMKESLFGCAAFAVTDSNGNHLMGRNTDYPETDCLMLYSDPVDGYDSIALVDLSIINIGTGEDQVSPTSFTGRLATLAMPYFTIEGMNEAGFGVSILELEHEEIHQNLGRKDTLLNVAVRAVLDRCATVDEAVAMLEQFDMNTMLGATFHLFMCDKTGRSVVVEWLGDKMYVTDNPAITNYVIGNTSYYGEENGDGRYEVLMEDLDGCACVASASEAMGFLSDVGYDNKKSAGIGTEWSCVYDLDNFTVTVCFDVKYDQPITVMRDTFN
ncbi:linear amide C-N hydrolase [Butyrivibrio sp. AE2032]|uniref:linear amide C-N hydrolase n=1 Tax=Butyrivibrio sp. AE2032 TaxID=1458463 RepID=UPI000558F7E0|nr:linear amide C-N hydrolase [Butyrivibrio sp. AE2032]